MAVIPINPYGTGGGQASGVTTMRPVRIKMERGGLKSTGAMDYTLGSNGSYEKYIRSSMLIRINDATKVTGKTLTSFTVYEYNSSFVKVKESSPGDTFASSTRYIKIFKQTADVVEEAVLLFDGDVEEVYNVQIEKGTSGGYMLSETLVFDVGEDVYTTARLLLPSNYNISGKKVPLIIWCACDGSYPSWDFKIDYASDNSTKVNVGLQYLVDNGFAVLNVYPWGSYNASHFPNCGMSGAVPVPVTLRVYEKAVEYVTTRFNISDTNIFQTSWSGSGKLSAYYAIHKPGFSLRHIYAFAPVVDGGTFRASGEKLNDGTGFRGAANSEMHFDGDSADITNYLSRWNNTINTQAEIDFVTANAGKFAKFSSIKWQNLTGSYLKDGVLHEHTIADKIADTVAWGDTWRNLTSYPSPPANFDWSSLRNANIYNRHTLAISSDGAPITIIGAEDDKGCPYLAMEEFIIQLRNGGAEAKIINLPNETSSNGGVGTGHEKAAGHRAPIFFNQINDIPYGWWYAVQDIKARFLKT